MTRPCLGIRLDCGPQVGLGHVGRCLPVAKAWAAGGGAVRFVVAGGEPGPERLRQAGFAADVLPAPGAAAWRRWRTETTATPDVWLFDVRDDLTADDLRALRPALTAVLDDPTPKRLGADLAFYPPVPQVEALDWTGFAGRRLTGFAYVPLDPRLAEPASAPARAAGAPPDVLVTMGGGDPDGLTRLGVEALALVEAPFAATVIVPAGCPERQACLAWGTRLGDKVRLVDGPVDLLPFLRRAHLALAAFGTTAYELAAVGCPAVLISPTADHARSAACLTGAGAAVLAGCVPTVSPATVAAIVTALLRDADRRATMASRARRLGLGPGAANIAAALLAALPHPATANRDPRP